MRQAPTSVTPSTMANAACTSFSYVLLKARLDSLVHYESGIGSLNSALGFDVSGFDPDGPLPEIPPTNASQSAHDRMRHARGPREPHDPPAWRRGSAAMAAWPSSARRPLSPTAYGAWLDEEGSDGFNIMFPYLPEGLDDFVDKVVPELQRATSSAPSMRAPRCGKIWVWRGRPTGSSIRQRPSARILAIWTGAFRRQVKVGRRARS